MSVLAETSLHAKPWRDAKAAIAYSKFNALQTSKTLSQCCRKQHLSTTEVEYIITSVSDW